MGSKSKEKTIATTNETYTLYLVKETRLLIYARMSLISLIHESVHDIFHCDKDKENILLISFRNLLLFFCFDDFG